LLVKGREELYLVNFNIGSDTVIHGGGGRGVDIFGTRRRRVYMQSRTEISLHLESS